MLPLKRLSFHQRALLRSVIGFPILWCRSETMIASVRLWLVCFVFHELPLQVATLCGGMFPAQSLVVLCCPRPFSIASFVSGTRQRPSLECDQAGKVASIRASCECLLSELCSGLAVYVHQKRCESSTK